MYKRIKIRVEAEAVLPEHMVKRIAGQMGAGPRDRKLLVFDVIQDDKNPKVEVLEITEAKKR